MRSRTGCLTCRSRKLKCDEQKPVCGQCRRGSRQCRPSDGIVFRHQQNASMNKDGTSSETGGGLNRFYSYKNTFDEDSVWLDIPKQVIFIDNSDPYVEELEASLTSPDTPFTGARQAWNDNGSYQPRPMDAQTTRGLEALSAAATQETLSLRDSASRHITTFDQSDIPPLVSSISPSNHVQHSLPPPGASSPPVPSPSDHISTLLNPSTSRPTPIDPSLPSPADGTASPSASNQSPTSRYATNSNRDMNVESDHEVAFLLRHFSESPGQWLDLFDLGTYFSGYVPVKARTNPLLKYAACAYAAKQLGRARGAKAIFGGICGKQARMEVWSEPEQVDWYYYGAKYYEKAIHLLMDALKHDSHGPSLSNPEAFGRWQEAELVESSEHPNKRRRRFSSSRLSGAHSDEVLAATAILSVYEFLDATDPAWNGHLSGVKSLLDIAEVGILPIGQLDLPEGTHIPARKRHGFSKARRASFWTFARQDYLSAFINGCQTRLDTDDLDLWTEAGLLLDETGFVKPSNTTESGYSEGEDLMKEDMISNALIWILSKVVNFAAVGDGVPGNSGQSRSAARVGVSQHTLLDRWQHLQSELDVWYDSLPETFKPCARIEPSSMAMNQGDTYPFPEVWYSIPMCAGTMQHYHMARILMLVNKPHGSISQESKLADRLKSYRSIPSEIRFHSHEICQLSMGRPEASVRIHSVQPLFVSGLSLTDPRERRTILQTLRDIETDLGWATEYRVKQLLREWEWTENA